MATITSNQSGNWNVTSTWVGGNIPAADDLVVIAHGHKVNVTTNIQSTRTGDVTIDGNLHFANGGKMHLHGRMTVKNTSYSSDNTGEFVQGTAASGSLLSMANGTEIKISGSQSDQHGISVDSRKWCGVDLQGGEPTHYTNLNGVHAPESAYLSVDDATGFASGDMISLYEREVDFRVSPDECMFVHDVDETNNRLYFRQYVGPKATVISKSGSTIKVDEPKVFRVGYRVVFGTGSNVNSKVITAISGNIISFGSTVSGTVDNEDIFVSGNEKRHTDNRIVRRLATTVKTAITSIDSTNQLVVGDASDLSVGDEIMLEAGTDDGTYNYTSGSESNVWRHNILYTISSKSGNTLTLNRNIPYKSDVGCLVVRMTRDIVIKACKTDGTEVPDGDRDSARVFFSVRYWTSNGWQNASTRRVKIKYVRFKNLGYNTNDGTNFRAGVTIGGYNGRVLTNVTGSSVDETTIHNSNGVSQTGENYIDGCVLTAYSQCANTARDGDTYPSLCVRHPYGHVNRNNVACGTGYGLWRWSSGYFVKESGGISMVANHTAYLNEAMYADHSCVEYITVRMAEDYGFRISNVRDSSSKHIRHIDSRTMQSYAFQIGYLALDGPLYEKWYADKYRYLHINTAARSHNIINSKFLPNRWDGSSQLYGGPNGSIYDYVNMQSTGYTESSKNPGGIFNFKFLEHGFKSDEILEYYGRIMRLRRSDKSEWEVIVASADRKAMYDKIFIPAGTTVRIQCAINVNTKTYSGSNAGVGTNDYPILIAKPQTGLEMWRVGRYIDHNTGSFSQGENHDGSNLDSGLNSTTGNLGDGFVEKIRYTSASLGSWETKQITVQPQTRGYILTYGLYWTQDGMRSEGMKMKDIEIALDNPSPMSNGTINTNLGKVSVRTSFSTGKKRIGGTRL
jgi:hypothetical protein